MTERRPESAQPLPGHVGVLRCVTMPAIPAVYGLEDPDEGVTSWVFALPGGLAYVVSSDEEENGAVVHTTLEQVVNFWAPFHDVDLVLVAT